MNADLIRRENRLSLVPTLSSECQHDACHGTYLWMQEKYRMHNLLINELVRVRLRLLVALGSTLALLDTSLLASVVSRFTFSFVTE
jgi:hypothetical protein